MTERDDYAALFDAHLPFIDKVVASVTRVLGLRGADAQEFAAWARERLWEGDYAILRKWRRESRLTTYLTTVVTNLGREFRVKRWGRWRSSAAAQRLGSLAVRLEILVYRDGLRVDEAAELLRTRGETTASNRELAELLAKIPERRRPPRVDERVVPIEAMADGATADERLIEQETSAERRTAYRVLFDAIDRLQPEEQIVIRMHYLDGRSLADVARALAVPQKPLYRVKDRALEALGRHLQAAGVTREHVRGLLGGVIGDTPAAENPDEAWPSNQPCDSNPAQEANGSSDSVRSGRSDP
jgi:RNA polymerase sigma factor for flagellar operon FliA